ncbi:MAG: TetR/AcrR family transcriptional regulator [Bacteroidota bacterium]
MELSEKQIPWIREGYKVFAQEGPPGLKIERLARAVEKNKSSFYHYFADLEIFTEELLKYHLKRAYEIAEIEKQSQNLEELMGVMVAHKEDLLFNRQLRVHRTRPLFMACLQETNEIFGQSIMHIWAQALGLEYNSYLAALVLKLSIENFFLQITEEHMNISWLKNYFQEIREMVQAFKMAPEFQ